MEDDPVFKDFRERRRRFYDQWECTRLAVEALLNQFESHRPTAADAARFEALSIERDRLVLSYQKSANEFVDYIRRQSQRGLVQQDTKCSYL